MSSISILNDENSICIGCGLCAAMCPEKNYKMMWNEFGELVPKEVKACTLACGLCENVCPFKNTIHNEDTIGEEQYGSLSGISHSQETGYYLDSIVGYADEFRLTSASGGLATWFLEAALSTGLVDKIIYVTKSENQGKLFDFKVIGSKEDIRAGAGSVYYPVEMSEVISFALNNPGKYAITGLPCFIKAIRLAQKKNDKLKGRIVLTIGLTCGQLKSKYFTDYIAKLAGISGEVKSVRYRCKEMNSPPNNYYYSFNSQDGVDYKIFFWDGIREAWINRWFTPLACNYCDDIFAECADVSFMDAWLPEYSKESAGTSIAIIRSPLVNKIFLQGNDIVIKHIDIQKVIQSQSAVINLKRKFLSYRLYLERERGGIIPKKRIILQKPKNLLDKWELNIMNDMQLLSRRLWSCMNTDLNQFKNEMLPYTKKLNHIRNIRRLYMIPLRIFNKFLRPL